jgi:hypothetical protein
VHYRLCLVGGKELHNAIISSIQDLAKVFSTYNEEIMVQRTVLCHVSNAIGLFPSIVDFYPSDLSFGFRAKKNTFFAMLKRL